MKPPQSDSVTATRITELERQIEELKSRLPAHSISPAMMAQLDELEEALEREREKLKEEG